MTGIEGDDKGNKRLDLLIIEACANPGRKDDLMADIKALFGEWETDGADAMAVERLAEMIAKAWAELMRQKNRGEDPERIKEWERILSLPIPALTQKITERSETMDRLRLSSPLAFVVDFTDLEQRRRLLRIAKRGVLQHG